MPDLRRLSFTETELSSSLAAGFEKEMKPRRKHEWDEGFYLARSDPEREPKPRGRSKTTIFLLQKCREIAEALHPISVRGIAYQLFIRALIASMEVGNVAKVSRLLTIARRKEKIIPMDWIVDETRRLEMDLSFRDLREYSQCIKAWWKKDHWDFQPRYVVIVSEKSTVKGIIQPVREEWGVGWLSVHCFDSTTNVYDLAKKMAQDRRRFIFLYIGDYDPSGMYMSEVDLRKRLIETGEEFFPGEIDFELRRVALTAADTVDLGLGLSYDVTKKREGKKKGDPRLAWFLRNHGDRGWELDAMSPNALRDRVTEEIKQYIDWEKWESCKLEGEVERESLIKFTDRLAQIRAGANLI